MKNEISKIVVHCSDSPHRGDRAEDIHRWHLERGWSGIGYHYVIGEDGRLENGRPHYWSGSHVSGHNTGSIGIVLLGVDYFTPLQFNALRNLINFLLHLYPGAEVMGHRDLNPHKTCPNFDVKAWWAGVNSDDND